MAATLRYGDANLASFPDNVTGIISAENIRDFLVSTRVSFLNVTDDTPFTATMSNGVPTLINPLLPTPEVDGTLWTTDGNNRGHQQYAAQIPALVIPAGYQKLVEVSFKLGVDKLGAGSDTYLFQADLDGVPVGAGVSHTLTSDPLFFSVEYAVQIPYDVQHLIGLSVTPQGTSDDIGFESFQMAITDYQLWSSP